MSEYLNHGPFCLLQSPAFVYKLILHLSVADVLVSVVCIMGEAVWMLLVEWTFGNVACKVFKFLQMTALHGSSYVVVLIARNRCVAVNRPLRSRRSADSLCGSPLSVDSPRSVLFVWLVGALLSSPQVSSAATMTPNNSLSQFYRKIYHFWTKTKLLELDLLKGCVDSG